MERKRKTLRKVQSAETYLSMTKAINVTLTVYLIVNGKKAKSASIKINTRMSSFTTVIQYNVGSSSHSNQEKI